MALPPTTKGRAARKGNIIEFYNSVFIANMKEYVQRFQRIGEQRRAEDEVRSVDDAVNFVDKNVRSVSTPQGTPQGTPKGTPTKKRRQAAADGFIDQTLKKRHRVPAISTLPNGFGPAGSPSRVERTNVYVSGSGFHQRNLTPMSRALYSFGESPATDLAVINKAMGGARGGGTADGKGRSLMIPSLNEEK